MREIAAKLSEWWDHPAQMVREMFGIEPDPWQIEALEAFPTCQRLAMKACKGPGKTALLAWIGWNFLATRPHPKCAATSITGKNLEDNLWTEMAKWRDKSPFLKKMFTWTKTRIVANDHPETWFMSARTWPQSGDPSQQADALAGLHADYILFLLDETGSMPEAVMASAEAALSSCVEGHLVQAGNPTMLSGPLYRAATTERRLWKMIEITGDPDSPRRSSRISIQWAREQIEKYGADNPWVLVNVFGKFPPSSINSLIGPDELTAATQRVYNEHHIGQDSKVLGVDVARFGDAQSVVAPRQGLQIFNLLKYRNINSVQGAGQVSRIWADFGADACFVDDTGGFGAGWIDQLIVLKRSPIGVTFSGKAHNHARYFNKRTEIYFDFVQWIKRGGAIPNDPMLVAALTQTTYSFKGDKLILEPKEDVAAKLNGHSPDEADACALTHAEPVIPAHAVPPPMARRQQPDWNPYREDARQDMRRPARAMNDWNAYGER